MTRRRAYAYSEAQATIDDPTQKEPLAVSLRGINRLAKIMKQKRLEQG